MPVSQPSDTLRTVATNVRLARESRGLTQAQLAEAAGLELRQVQRVEAGNINFGILAFVAVASALDVDADELLRTALSQSLRKPGRPRK